MDNTSSIYVPHGSCYEDSSVFQYQKMNYESYHLHKLNKYKANNIKNTIFYIVWIYLPQFLVTKNYMM